MLIEGYHLTAGHVELQKLHGPVSGLFAVEGMVLPLLEGSEMSLLQPTVG